MQEVRQYVEDVGQNLHHNQRARKTVQSIPKIPRVVKSDGTPVMIELVEGSDIASIDAVIHRIAENPLVETTDSKVARWID